MGAGIYTIAAIGGLVALGLGMVLFCWLVARFIERFTAQQHPSDLADYASACRGDCHCADVIRNFHAQPNRETEA